MLQQWLDISPGVRLGIACHRFMAQKRPILCTRRTDMILRLFAIPFFTAVALLLSGFSQAAERKLLVVAEPFAPYEFVQQDQAVGIDVDVISQIFDEMGIEHEVSILPWVRAWDMIAKGEADAVLSTSRKDKRKPYLYYPEEDLWVSEFVFFVRKDKMREDFQIFEDIIKDRLVVGVIKGNSYHPPFWEAFPYQDADKSILHPQLDEAIDAETNFRKLAAGRIDLYIVPRTIGLYTIKKLGLQDEITYYPHVLFSKGYPMPFAKKSDYPDLQSIAREFEERLKVFKKTEKYKDIYESWLE